MHACGSVCCLPARRRAAKRHAPTPYGGGSRGWALGYASHRSPLPEFVIGYDHRQDMRHRFDAGSVPRTANRQPGRHGDFLSLRSDPLSRPAPWDVGSDRGGSCPLTHRRCPAAEKNPGLSPSPTRDRDTRLSDRPNPYRQSPRHVLLHGGPSQGRPARHIVVVFNNLDVGQVWRPGLPNTEFRVISLL